MEADPGQTVPWAITRLNTLDSKIVKAAMNEYKEQDGIVLTDCPGNLNDNNLSILYSIADLIVIPMSYDVDTIDATGIFVSVISQKSSARLVFLPNRINTTEGKAHEREMRDETISVLGRLGTVTPRIKQPHSTLSTSTSMLPLSMLLTESLKSSINYKTWNRKKL